MSSALPKSPHCRASILGHQGREDAARQRQPKDYPRQNSAQSFHQQVEAGTLVAVLAPFIRNHGQFRVVGPSTHRLTPKVRAFVDFMAKELAATLKVVDLDGQARLIPLGAVMRIERLLQRPARRIALFFQSFQIGGLRTDEIFNPGVKELACQPKG